ncbi:LysR family transcriptional regulator [Undibacterium terreum]|uniref:LysR family transcriptional regulator n=1 Tax=Undibacterium terreum TaxID=1224302 RepID=A0A916UV86_9BURK|nr:LysR family transcriptional regulator [Undibacterium terreum]GGC88428.1 LysR family transcriptional regulator [Undibacterium terreum]
MPKNTLVTPLILHAMPYFEAAARNRSFTRAAEELHVTQGAVSQQIKGLEEQVGVQLFKRLARGLELTQEGERLFRVVHLALGEIETTVRAIQPAAMAEALVIRSSPSFSMMWLMPRLSRFSRLYPDIEIRLRGELFGMSMSRMNLEGVDVLVLYEQFSSRYEQELTPLMGEYLLPVASPGFLQEHPVVQDTAAFQKLNLLHDDAPWEGAAAYAEWAEWLRLATQDRSGAVEQYGTHGHQYNLAQLAINAALHGEGIAMARTSLIREELAAQRLLPVVPLATKASASYGLVQNNNARNSRAVGLFTEWIREECRAFEAERNGLLASMARLV